MSRTRPYRVWQLAGVVATECGAPVAWREAFWIHALAGPEDGTECASSGRCVECCPCPECREVRS